MTKIFACLQADWYLRVSSPVRQLTSGQSPRTSVHIGSVRYVSSHRVSSPVRQLTSGRFPGTSVHIGQFSGTSVHIGSVHRYVCSHQVSSPVRQLTNNWRRGRIAATGLSEKCKRPPNRYSESGGWRRRGGKVGSVCVGGWGGGSACVCVWRGEGGRDR